LPRDASNLPAVARTKAGIIVPGDESGAVGHDDIQLLDRPSGHDSVTLTSTADPSLRA